MNADKFARTQFIRGKRDEIAMLERDLADKKQQLADAEAAERAEAVTFSDDPRTAPKTDKK